MNKPRNLTKVPGVGIVNSFRGS